jgi:hypothetical protein
MLYNPWSKDMTDSFTRSWNSHMKRDGKWGTQGISNNHQPKLRSTPSKNTSTFVSKRRSRSFHRNYYFGRTTLTQTVRNPQAACIVGAYDVRTIRNRNLGLSVLVDALVSTLIACPIA